MKAEKSGPKVAAIAADHARRGGMARLEPDVKEIGLRANAEDRPIAKVKGPVSRLARAAAKARDAGRMAARPVNAVKRLCHCRISPCLW
jgi:hypothetical protein